MKMKKNLLIIPLCCALICALSCNNDNKYRDGKDSGYSSLDRSSDKNGSDPVAQLNTKAVNLRVDMRRLWMDHITYTRDVVLHVIDGLPGTDATVDRLMENQEDIGDAIKPYYGKDAGDQLTALLKNHISEAAALLKAAKVNNKSEFNRLDDVWKQNADSIAHFLSSANSHWSYNDVKKMMDRHLDLTKTEAVDRQKGDYKDDVKNFDKVRDEILEMSDMLTEGIIKQFPDKFRSGNEKLAGE